MKRILFLCALASCLPVITGCKSMGAGAKEAMDGVADVIRAAAVDPASQDLEVVTTYGTVKWKRVGASPGLTSSANQDGSISSTWTNCPASVTNTTTLKK